MVVLIILLFLVLIAFIWLILNHFKVIDVVNKFKKCNVIVFGKKGTGKDLVFQYVINKRKDIYYSNIYYGNDYRHIDVKELSTGNTYDEFIKGCINTCDKVPEREGKDIYLSDCGIILPSQYDSTLHKIFPSFSSYYALSRHLYNSNVHCNTQALSRVWKALREQADYYVNTKGTFSIFGFMITKVVTYEKYETAVKGITPFKCPIGINSTTAKEQYREFEAVNGVVASCYIIQRVKALKYDTRSYHKIIFGQTFDEWKLSTNSQVR